MDCVNDYECVIVSVRKVRGYISNDKRVVRVGDNKCVDRVDDDDDKAGVRKSVTKYTERSKDE